MNFQAYDPHDRTRKSTRFPAKETACLRSSRYAKEADRIRDEMAGGKAYHSPLKRNARADAALCGKRKEYDAHMDKIHRSRILRLIVIPIICGTLASIIWGLDCLMPIGATVFAAFMIHELIYDIYLLIKGILTGDMSYLYEMDDRLSSKYS